MAGTKMTLYREGGQVLDWVDQHIVVDANYILTQNMLITVSTSYEMGLGQLDVYFNGHRLIEGHGYDEIDEYTIRLKLSVLNIGDEIFIRNWRNKFMYSDINTLADLYNEVTNARKYLPNNTPFVSLDARLDFIQGNTSKVIVFVLPGKLVGGVQKVIIKFPYDGEILRLYASCCTSGGTDTEITLGKISQNDFDLGGSFVSVLSSSLWIDAGEKSSNTASSTYVLDDAAVSAGDHFNVQVLSVGTDIADVVIEVEINLV